MSGKKKMIKPNTTQVPNVFFDHVMAELEKSELKCTLYIIRRTFGFHKDGDYIPLSQFVDGIVKKNGERLDHGTGLDKKTVISALKSLIEKGIVLRIKWCFKCKKEIKGHHCACLAQRMSGSFYALSFEDYEPVFRGHDSTITDISGGIAPDLRGNDSQIEGASDHPQKKVKRKEKERDPEVDLQGSPPAHEEVYKNIYQGDTVNQEGGRNVEPKRKSDRYSYGGYSFEKTPNLEGAAIFKRMAKHGAPDDGESSDSNPGYKLNCMKCGMLTEFENRDAAVDGNCKKCKEPIFSEEEKVK